MPLRFNRRVRIAKGVYINVGKKGISSVTVGTRGFSTNVSKKGTRRTYSLPGTGISYQTKQKPYGTRVKSQRKRKSHVGCGGCGCVLPVAMVALGLCAGVLTGETRRSQPLKGDSGEVVSD